MAVHRRILAVVFLVAAAVTVAVGGSPPTVALAAAPDGGRVIGNLAGEGVVAVDADGTNVRTLVERGFDADQTADATRLVFVRDGVLHVAAGDGSAVRAVGAGTIQGREPRWSPDATRIAFTAGTFEAPTIAIVNADGTGQQLIAAGSSPDWSPDGQQLAYRANERIWLVPARPGATAVALTKVLPVPEAPRWSPDGTRIGFGGLCIGVVHPDGSGERCLNEFGSPGPAGRWAFGGWSPDSQHYASWWTGFHHWSGTHWRDPRTGDDEYVSSLFFSTDWAGPPGPVPCGAGYWLLGRDGGVFTFGAADFYGSTGGMRLNQPVVGMSGTATGDGYWLVASDGGVFSFGDARFHGSTGALRLKAPIVGMARTPSGDGYWLVASDGGVFTFGDAPFHGSTGALRLKAPIVGMAPTAAGEGYWLVASDGGIFTFGDAGFHGSAGGLQLAAPIVGMAPSATGGGYVLVGRDGGTFVYGDAPSPGNLVLPDVVKDPPVAAAVGVPAGDGVLTSTTSGEVAALGSARWCGSVRGLRLAAPIVGAAVAEA